MSISDDTAHFRVRQQMIFHIVKQWGNSPSTFVCWESVDADNTERTHQSGASTSRGEYRLHLSDIASPNVLNYLANLFCLFKRQRDSY